LENLIRQGFETFIPLIEKTKRINSSFKNSFSPLFPGYVFISFDINEYKWVKIKSTIGVLRIISFYNKPSEVPGDIIVGLKQKYSHYKNFLSLSDLKKGSTVKIIKGPFSGFVGEVEDYDEKSRLKILLKFMDNYMNVSISSKSTNLISK